MSNGNIENQMWSIEDSVLGFGVEEISLSAAWLEDYDCNSFTLDTQIFAYPYMYFTRM